MQLTPREFEAVAWAAHGLCASEIAQEMSCSYSTAKSFLATARRRYEALNTANLVYLVYKELRDEAME